MTRESLENHTIRFITAVGAVFVANYVSGLVDYLIRPDAQPATPLTSPQSDAIAKRQREPLPDSISSFIQNRMIFEWRGGEFDADVIVSDFGDGGRTCTPLVVAEKKLLPDLMAESLGLLDTTEQITTRYQLKVGSDVWAMLEESPVEISVRRVNSFGQIIDSQVISPGKFIPEFLNGQALINCTTNTEPISASWSPPAG